MYIMLLYIYSLYQYSNSPLTKHHPSDKVTLTKDHPLMRTFSLKTTFLIRPEYRIQCTNIVK